MSTSLHFNHSSQRAASLDELVLGCHFPPFTHGSLGPSASGSQLCDVYDGVWLHICFSMTC